MTRLLSTTAASTDEAIDGEENVNEMFVSMSRPADLTDEFEDDADMATVVSVDDLDKGAGFCGGGGRVAGLLFRMDFDVEAEAVAALLGEE